MAPSRHGKSSFFKLSQSGEVALKTAFCFDSEKSMYYGLEIYFNWDSNVEALSETFRPGMLVAPGAL